MTNKEADVLDQEPNSIHHLSATADGQIHAVSIIAKYDNALPKSIITSNKAGQSGATVSPVPWQTLKDADGISYTTNARLTLRWHYLDEPQSFTEDFYIVSDEQMNQPPQSGKTHDAILRRDIIAPRAHRSSGAYPILVKPETSKERDAARKKQKEVEERNRVKADDQAALVRKALEDARSQRRGVRLHQG